MTIRRNRGESIQDHRVSRTTGCRSNTKRVTWNLDEEIAKVVEKGVEANNRGNSEWDLDEERSLPRSISDHSAIMLGILEDIWGLCPFRFHNKWLEDKSMLKEVKKGWVACKPGGSTSHILQSKLRISTIYTKRWVVRCAKRKSTTKSLEDQLAKIDNDAASDGWTESSRKVKWKRQSITSLSFNKISEVDRDWLEERFRDVEVVKALDSCDRNKATGPDGFNLGFVQANWDVIKGDFMKCLEEFYYDEEAINHWKTSKECGLLVKLDFEKAYDTVDHTFLDDMLKEMGFSSKWRHWVLNCISSPKLFVLVNRKPSREFGLERGLRQEDPLFSLLFNVVVEGLNALFRKAIDLNMIKGVVLGNEEEQISHLQFVDDTIVFLQPKEQFLRNARRILRCYDLVSGLHLNFQKTSIVKVGKGCVRQGCWADIFRCARASLHISYLGLTLGGRPRLKYFWADLVRRVESRLAPWKKLFLNKGGRLVLIKSIMSSLPTYFMFVFSMPVMGFKRRKFILLSGKCCAKAKKEGGLGIGSVQCMNKGLLAKWVWRFGVENLVWYIWEERNQMIFKDILVDSVRMEDMVRFRVGWWFKHFGGGSLDPITLILWNIVDRCSEASKRSFSNLQKWIPPTTNFLKFNVDGSVRISPGFTGIGGVLRNHLDKVLCFFSSYVGVQDVTSEEILAIARTCDLFGSRPDLVRWRLIIACDSKSAVEWVTSRDIEGSNHEQLISHIRNNLHGFGQASVVHCPRASNSYADILAKKGSTGCEDV
ncbi:hypothetical protein Ddye_011207 [Dipteronia dyeriana]|uniref:Reverse transcriptase domain-containing protein n=1 Tax=Dipteronia dyeriana TaxID=168575 RepID=A0AAD9UBU3_9ROSI|nr:hypothetical protein Ddye_011207 [Dipteronia dyeriana]